MTVTNFYSLETEEVLARTLIGEASGEGDPGMEDVACTVINRARKPCWWGHSVKEVCLFPEQYSCWNQGPDRDRMLAVPTNAPLYLEAFDIASRAIAGQLVDRTHTSTHYKRIGTFAKWAIGHTPVFTEGHHEFFNDIP